MAVITTTTYAALLKRIYSPKQVQYMAFKKRPLLGLVKKNTTNFGGSSYSVPVEYGRNAGRSATFATAQTNAGGTSSATFLVTRSHDYGVAQIENEAILASQGNNAAFMPALKNAMERTIDAVSMSLSHAIWGTRGGAIGTMAAGWATDTITLTNPEDAVNFFPGQVLEGSLTDGGGAGVFAGLTVTVASVDYDTGSVTCTAANVNWNAATGFNGNCAAGVFLFQQGDYDGKMPGVQDWITSTASPAALYGVTRTAAPNDLAGLRPVVSAAATIHEKLILACGSAARMGAQTDHIFLNPEDVSDLTLELEGKVVYNKVTSPKQSEIAQVSFDSIKFMTPMGAVDVVADMHCPKGRAYGLNMSTWELGSLGGAPRVLAEGDDIFITNQDAKEIRVGYYGAIYCTAPSQNWTISLA